MIELKLSDIIYKVPQLTSIPIAKIQEEAKFYLKSTQESSSNPSNVDDKQPSNTLSGEAFTDPANNEEIPNCNTSQITLTQLYKKSPHPSLNGRRLVVPLPIFV